jgi:hypothetical protein
MERAGDTQAIPYTGIGSSGSPVEHEQTHEAIFEEARARIDAIAREWSEAVSALGSAVGPAAEQLPSPAPIHGPMATAPIQL